MSMYKVFCHLVHKYWLRLEVRDGGVPVTIAVEFVAGIEEVLVTEKGDTFDS